MLKPKNYDTTAAFGEYESLPAGNYVCKVFAVEEGTSKKGNAVLRIYLDVAKGEHAGIFNRRFQADDRQPPRWPATLTQLTEDADGNCSRGLKSFIGAVKASNPGFDEDRIWGENFCRYFKGVRVGASFRREEYINSFGEAKWSVKPYRFFDAAKVEEMDAPKDKPLSRQETGYGGTDAFSELDSAPGELPWS